MRGSEKKEGSVEKNERGEKKAIKVFPHSQYSHGLQHDV